MGQWKKRPKVEIDLEDLRKKREEGWTYEKLAVHFNCSQMTIVRRLKKIGLIEEKVPLISKEEFYENYIVKNMTRAALCQTYKISPKTFDDIARYYKIYEPKEKMSELISKSHRAYKGTKEELEDYFIVQNHTLVETAEHFEITFDALRHTLRRLGIKKPSSKSAGNLRKTLSLKNPERPDQVKSCYIDENLTIEETAEKLGIHSCTVEEYLKKYGIVKSPEAKQECVKRSCMKTYGQTSWTRKNWKKETGEILDNKEKFVNFFSSLEYKTVKNAAEELGCSSIKVGRVIKQYGLEHMVDAYTSQGEIWIDKLLNSIGVFHYKTKKIIFPYELDFYCPDQKIAIEFNGEYWHNINQHGMFYHFEKTNRARKKGIFLIHIYESEWLDPRKRKRLEFYLRSIFSDKRDEFFRKFVLFSEKDGMYLQDLGKVPDYIYEQLGLSKIAQSPPSPIPETERDYIVYDCGYGLWVKLENSKKEESAYVNV